MHRLLAFLSLVVSYAAWPGSWARAQQPANAGAPNAAATLEQPATTIRTTTRLVQVSVVVTDKKGAPITGFKSEDFAVFDQSNPQEIAFFLGRRPRLRHPHSHCRRMPSRTATI